jgi:glycosyltransferase involved in cell wall biosynthesis
VAEEEEARGAPKEPAAGPRAPAATSGPIVIVAARNEADRVGSTLAALADAFPGAELWVADDASTDATAEVALVHGAHVVSRGSPHGKGGNVSAVAEAVRHRASEPDPPTFLLCDADLGASAGELRALVDSVEAGGECDLAIATFRERVGGGFGIALRFARWAIERRCGYRAIAPISGQRAMRAAVFLAVTPFAPGFGMEIGITIDAVRSGVGICEIELDLDHRPTGRTPRGFLHRGRQLLDFARVYRARRGRNRVTQDG